MWSQDCADCWAKLEYSHTTVAWIGSTYLVTPWLGKIYFTLHFIIGSLETYMDIMGDLISKLQLGQCMASIEPTIISNDCLTWSELVR